MRFELCTCRRDRRAMSFSYRTHVSRRRSRKPFRRGPRAWVTARLPLLCRNNTKAVRRSRTLIDSRQTVSSYRFVSSGFSFYSINVPPRFRSTPRCFEYFSVQRNRVARFACAKSTCGIRHDRRTPKAAERTRRRALGAAQQRAVIGGTSTSPDARVVL